ncbi:hypothetical protein RLEG12_03180 (plasmid) [Rhizobium leguminosarum bv. trifolii CB782]|nr:hypothetical protein RLEG12_03180 [Rhizobium leguminosarum bv. trifolii CB782]
MDRIPIQGLDFCARLRRACQRPSVEPNGNNCFVKTSCTIAEAAGIGQRSSFDVAAELLADFPFERLDVLLVALRFAPRKN